MSTRAVRVDLGRRGNWEVMLSDQRDRITCETLAAARRLAHRYAAHRHPCELVVFDAYHRVLQHEIIDHHDDDVAGSDADFEQRRNRLGMSSSAETASECEEGGLRVTHRS